MLAKRIIPCLDVNEGRVVKGVNFANLLDAGEDKILQKIGEEAIEVILAAKSQGRQRVIEEIADLTYHLLVLLAAHEITPAEVAAELDHRHKPRPSAPLTPKGV